jgi:hypothetical protein
MKDRFLLTDTFIESISLFDKGLKASLWKCLSLLSKNYLHPSLNTEKLNGIFSSRINIDYRLIHAPSEDLFRLLFAGKHEDAYRFADKCKDAIAIMPEKRRSLRVAEPEAFYSLDIEVLEKEKKMQRSRLRLSADRLVRKWRMFKIEGELVPGNVYNLKKLRRYFMKHVGKN